MKKFVREFLKWALTATILVPSLALAATAVSDLIGLGMAPELAQYVGTKLITVNSSGNTVIPVASGKKLSITVAGTEKGSLSSTGLFTSAGGQTATTGDSTTTAGDFIAPAAAKGFVAGEASRAANVTTATTLAAPLYLSMAAAGGDIGAIIGSGVSASGPTIDFFKTRATTGAATTIVASADVLGALKFFGANGTTYDPAAAIIAKVDGTPGASADMPGSLDFQLSPDGSVTLASVLKLTNDKLATFTGSILMNTADTGFRENIGTLAALGTNQGTCAPMVTAVARVTAADGTVGVCLPAITAAKLGRHYAVLNTNVTNALKVYSAASETITGQAGSTAISVAAKLFLDCWAYDTSNWYCQKGVLPY